MVQQLTLGPNLRVGCGFSRGFMRSMSEDKRMTSGQSSHKRKFHHRRTGNMWPRFLLHRFKERGTC